MSVSFSGGTSVSPSTLTLVANPVEKMSCTKCGLLYVDSIQTNGGTIRQVDDQGKAVWAYTCGTCEPVTLDKEP